MNNIEVAETGVTIGVSVAADASLSLADLFDDALPFELDFFAAGLPVEDFSDVGFSAALLGFLPALAAGASFDSTVGLSAAAFLADLASAFLAAGFAAAGFAVDFFLVGFSADSFSFTI